MGSIKKSLKTTWWLFEANSESKANVITHRVLFVLAPIIVGAGVGISLALSSGSVVLGLFSGLAILILVAGAMSNNSPAAQDHVTRYLADNEYIDPEREYVKTFEDRNSRLQPAFYRGVGEWMCSGHAPIKEFIESVVRLDNTLHDVPYQTLEDAVQYNYAITTFSHRLRREAMKIVSKETEGAFKITRLKAPYDLYLSDNRISPAEDLNTNPLQRVTPELPPEYR